jgi:hypothetical protein
MGLIRKMFGRDDARPSGGSSQFAESHSQTSLEQTKSRNAPRRDLVKVVLRDTMRKHGIPSDWIDCRSLSVLTHQHKSGMHVQFLVRKADHQLLPYVHAFQESFWEGVLRMDPTAHDWLFSVGWEFYEKSIQDFSMPDPTSWKSDRDRQGPDTETQEAGDTLPPDQAEDLATDLHALQALMSAPADLTNLPDAKPREHKVR